MRRSLVVAVALGTAACAGRAPAPLVPAQSPPAPLDPAVAVRPPAAPPAAPTRGPAPPDTVDAPVFPPSVIVDPAAIVAEAAELFGPERTTWDIDVESFQDHGRVQYYIDFFLGPARDRFAIWLTRLPRYEAMVRSTLRAYGLPEDLVYLALIESGYSNTAVSRARAVGMWQFISGTGRRYGLQIDHWVDERRDPFRATEAAARYLADLTALFGSYYLAAAAYNAGEGRISRGIARLTSQPDTLTDETFFELASQRRLLRLETRDYVPKLIAAALIAKEPARYGFESVVPLEPLVFDEITVPDATGLDVLARLADTTVSAVRELNPHFVRGVTPPRRTVVVRVPRATGELVAERYAELPKGKRVTYLEHRVRRGETLSEIAHNYGVALSAIEGSNPGIRPRALQVGQLLVIPTSSRSAGSAPASRPATGNAGARTHRVRPGETMSEIAARYGVSLSVLLRANGMRATDVLKAGARIQIPR